MVLSVEADNATWSVLPMGRMGGVVTYWGIVTSHVLDGDAIIDASSNKKSDEQVDQCNKLLTS